MAVTDACIRLLLVEDVFDAAASLATYLESRGIYIASAYSAREAAHIALALPSAREKRERPRAERLRRDHP